ncbi:Eco47II family restriction endonuclease [Neisseria leonii]|uniref:Eco47II family restriction endonuclease n=1 Tax=Neisseria leonii TaxID=2995413 RepID=A0A9X4E9Z4_9NEIS|nr:Eco47II family restriction endonuclease [Neisseria sp. 51.81]MDD9328163.1 Eco47II family restriction endonuclease [Neisseria sp. 51.81]
MSAFDRQRIKEVLRPILVDSYGVEISDSELRRNTLDVFSASLESVLKNISFDEWIEQEKKRQVQKTLQNKIGELHQQILGTLDGIEDLGVGGVVDIRSSSLGIIAEIKNKYNTTKGNHKIAVYDDLLKMLQQDSAIRQAYYVEILPRNSRSYNKPFTPSDNRTRQRRPENQAIRLIDGQSFYTLVTGNTNALRELYRLLPELSVEILREEFSVIRDTGNFLNEAEFDFIYGCQSDSE